MNEGDHRSSKSRYVAFYPFRNSRDQSRLFSKSNDLDDDLDDFETENSNKLVLKVEDTRPLMSSEWMPPWMDVLSPVTNLLLGTTFFALNYSLLAMIGTGYPNLDDLGFYW